MKSELDWVVKRASETPGPAEYDNTIKKNSRVHRNLNLAGKISPHYNPSALERLCRMKSQLPGPLDYRPERYRPKTGGSAVLTSVPKIEADYAFEEASLNPGPGSYNSQARYRIPGVAKFPQAASTSDLDVRVKRGRDLPGPQDYDTATDERVRPPRGGRFNKSKAKSALEWELYRSSRLPASWDYSDTRSTLSTKGARFGRRGLLQGSSSSKHSRSVHVHGQGHGEYGDDASGSLFDADTISTKGSALVPPPPV